MLLAEEERTSEIDLNAKIVLKDLRQSYLVRNPGQKQAEEFIALDNFITQQM